MAAYIVLDITVHDPEIYEEYKKHSGATVEKYNGTFIVRGGTVEGLEGEWNPQRVVIIAFETAEQAKKWWDSEEYRAPKAIRNKASVSRSLLVQGV
jgi:uncharacterized protein (DUF1330 family)